MANERIAIDPAVMMGKPVVRGTRITVEHIVRECANGMTVDQIVDQYPRLTREDVLAALAFAADYRRNEVTIAAQ